MRSFDGPIEQNAINANSMQPVQAGAGSNPERIKDTVQRKAC
jgi:hypothetical protein